MIIIRYILFLPALVVGTFVAVIVTAIWNLPLTFLEWINDLFGGWSLLALLGFEYVNAIDAIYTLSSGFFISTIGLLFALNIFPKKNLRKYLSLILTFLLLVQFSQTNQIEMYEYKYLFYLKIIGILFGSLIIYKLISVKNLDFFDIVDNYFVKNRLKDSNK